MTQLTASQVYAYALAGGFDAATATLATQIAYMESSWNPDASNSSAAGGKWGPAVGLMQVRSLVSPPASGVDSWRVASKLTDPTYNMQAAHAIYAAQGWAGWETYSNVTANTAKYQQAVSATSSAASGSDATTGQNAVFGVSNPLKWPANALGAVTDLDTILKHVIDPQFWKRMLIGWAGFWIVTIGMVMILVSSKTATGAVKKTAKTAAEAAAVAA